MKTVALALMITAAAAAVGAAVIFLPREVKEIKNEATKLVKKGIKASGV
jgi:hypothetical protein